MEIRYTDKCSTSRRYGFSVHPENGEYVPSTESSGMRMTRSPVWTSYSAPCWPSDTGAKKAKIFLYRSLIFAVGTGSSDLKPPWSKKSMTTTRRSSAGETFLEKRRSQLTSFMTASSRLKENSEISKDVKLPPLLDELPENDRTGLRELDYSSCEKAEWYGIYGSQFCKLLQKQERCGKPFIAAEPRAVYCSASCRNVMNVKLSRHRKRKAGRT